MGCTDSTACNYDSTASGDDGSCTFADTGYDCDGNCLTDSDGDDVCDEFEIAGCQDQSACNYDEDATDSDPSACDFSCFGCMATNACNFDPTATLQPDGACDYESCVGCANEAACNFDPAALISAPGSCEYPANSFVDCSGACVNDSDEDGVCDEQEIFGCTDENAPNYEEFATEDDGSCQVGGCIIPSPNFACNFDPDADYLIFPMCVNPPCASTG